MPCLKVAKWIKNQHYTLKQTYYEKNFIIDDFGDSLTGIFSEFNSKR